MDSYDGLALIGLILLTVGVYFVYAPLALIVPGVALLISGIYGGRSAGRSE